MYLLTKLPYVGVFFLGMISSSTIFLPLPADAAIFLAATKLNPFLVGILAGIGAGIGELTGYLVGAGGRLIVKERKKKRILPKPLRTFHKVFLKTFQELFKKYIFWFIVFACFIPFAFDFIGIFSGAIRYDIKKFLIATIIGKTIRYLLVAFLGYAVLGWLW